MAFDLDRRLARARARVHDMIETRYQTARLRAAQDSAIVRLWLDNQIKFHRRGIAQERSWRTVRRLPKEER